ncbi:MAG: hypothetical protein IJU27_02670 [Bacteroidales bacterium]|nr:hypothetical protein [Bacteroidales bacterium]
MKHLVFYIAAFAVILSLFISFSKLHARLLNNFKLLFCSCLALCVYACDVGVHYRADEAMDMASVEPVSISEPSISKICQIFGSRQLISAGDYIITITKNIDSLFYIIDPNTKEVLTSIGNKGRGPNDFLLPFSSKQYWKDDSGNTILVFIDSQGIYTINLSESVYNGYPVKEKIGNLASFGEYVATINQEAILGENESMRWIGPKYRDARDGLEQPPCFIHHTPDYDFDFNIFPRLFRNPSFREIHYFAHEGPFRIRPDKRKVAYSPSILDELVIFDLGKNSSKRVIGDSPFSFEDLSKKSYDNIINTGQLFSIDASVTNGLIAVLYDGRKIIDTQKENIGSSSYTKIFDWEGNTLAELHFDKYYTQISLNENNQELYLLDTEDNICRLDLQPYITTSSD